LQRKDAEELLHGYESGIIRQLPNGEFVEVHQPVNEEKRAVLEAKPVPALLPARGSEDANGVPSPGSRGALGWARGVANRAFAETIPVETNGNGHGNGHELESGQEHAAVGSAASSGAVASGGHGQLPAGDAAEEESPEGG
jgi:ubiquinol-cytochrome c reductase cytochrome b subunit